MLYIKLRKRFLAQMLAADHHWVFENHRMECVEVLREWVIQEAEFTLELLLDHSLRMYVGLNLLMILGRGYRFCRVCGKSHGVWS